MPDFDFDAFNHEGDGEEYTPDSNRSYPPNASAESGIVADNETAVNHTPVGVQAELTNAIVDDHSDADIVVAEAKQLEARETHASKGDNLSNEEVDKW